MRRCGESAVSMASMPLGAATHVLRGGKLVDRALEGCQLRLRRVDRGLIGGVLRLGLLLAGQLVVQVELGRMHRLGGLLGLARQLVELCQRVIGRVGLHISGENPAEQRQGRYRTDDGSLNSARGPLRTVEPQDLRPSNCRWQAAPNCS